MTPYRERHLQGDYYGYIRTERQDANTDQVEAEPRPAPDEQTDADTGLEVHPLDNLMRKELVAIADSNGIPNYGTRDQLLQRLKDRGVTQAVP